jgi:hypothetical protein
VGISVQWDNAEKTIVLITFDPAWTWKDVQLVDTRAIALYESVGHIVDVIADISHSQLVSTGFLSYIRSLLTTEWHPHVGVAVVVGASPSVRALFNAAALVARKPLERIRFAQSLDDARLMIKQRRANR